MDLNAYSEGKILLIDKPLTWTSFDVVKKLRYTLRVKKIGHAGTLDPLATGLLLIGTGKCTKRLNELQGLDKVYEGTFTIGKTTPSFDLETEYDSERSIAHLTEEDMLRAARKLTGPMDQVPPAHSAIRINGERAYKKARQNEEVKIDPRRVFIHEFDVPAIVEDQVHFRIKCSKGTYIRSIARDFGEILGVGGCLSALRRTQIGDYRVEDADQLDTFVAKIKDQCS